MLEAGKKAPKFSLPTDDGRDRFPRRLQGGSKVVLYFYPKDDTSGCTAQACGFRDSWKSVQAAGAVVLGVSPDGVASHGKFKSKYQLPFPLLADEDHAVAEAYGAWGEKSMYGRKYHGYPAHHLRHRHRRADREGLPEGEAEGACGRGARGTPGLSRTPGDGAGT